jgi:hypothetical protein
VKSTEAAANDNTVVITGSIGVARGFRSVAGSFSKAQLMQKFDASFVVQ